MNRISRTLISTCLASIFLGSLTFGQAWEVPVDKSKKVSPFKFNDETKKKGEAVFQRNCTSCHGIPTKANFVPLTPPPGDPATDKFQKQVDGALFYKITTGRGAMPSFKDVLTEEERWQVISYFRSFNSKYVQPEPATPTAGSFGGMDIQAKFAYLAPSKQIMLKVVGVKDNKSKPLEGLKISLYAKRYFGNLLIDEPKTTNESGEAMFDYKSPVPGDSTGLVSFKAKINEEGFDCLKIDTLLAIGTPNRAKSLIAERAMWSTRFHAPLWLILIFNLTVAVVWGILLYIMLQIGKIRKLGKKQQDQIEPHL